MSLESRTHLSFRALFSASGWRWVEFGASCAWPPRSPAPRSTARLRASRTAGRTGVWPHGTAPRPRWPNCRWCRAGQCAECAPGLQGDWPQTGRRRVDVVCEQLQTFWYSQVFDQLIGCEKLWFRFF